MVRYVERRGAEEGLGQFGCRVYDPRRAFGPRCARGNPRRVTAEVELRLPLFLGLARITRRFGARERDDSERTSSTPREDTLARLVASRSSWTVRCDLRYQLQGATRSEEVVNCEIRSQSDR